MREFDAFGFPHVERIVTPGRSSIASRIIASERGREFYDGERDHGYGGMRDDGRWASVARSMAMHYKLEPGALVLQIGCDKGYLLAEFQKLQIDVVGIEVSAYAISQTPAKVKHFIEAAMPLRNIQNDVVDFVICAGPVYTVPIGDAINMLRDIQRISQGRAFITLGAYESEKDYWLMRAWSLLGCTLLKPDEWRDVMSHCGYSGDYHFNTAKSLGLKWA